MENSFRLIIFNELLLYLPVVLVKKRKCINMQLYKTVKQSKAKKGLKADKNGAYSQRQGLGNKAKLPPISIMIFNMHISKKRVQNTLFLPIKRKTRGSFLNSCFFVWKKINYIWRIFESSSFLFNDEVGEDSIETRGEGQINIKPAE